MSEGVPAPCVLGGSGDPRCGGGERDAPTNKSDGGRRGCSEHSPNAHTHQIANDQKLCARLTQRRWTAAVRSSRTGFDTINDPLLLLNPYIYEMTRTSTTRPTGAHAYFERLQERSYWERASILDELTDDGSGRRIDGPATSRSGFVPQQVGHYKGAIMMRHRSRRLHPRDLLAIPVGPAVDARGGVHHNGTDRTWARYTSANRDFGQHMMLFGVIGSRPPARTCR